MPAHAIVARGIAGELLARTTPACHRLRDVAQTSAEPMPIKAEQSNTSVAYGDQFVLKVHRWVDEGINPEIEMVQALADKTDFTQVAALAGTLTYYAENRTPMTWASLSKFVPHEGDAWQYTVEAVRRFFEHVLTRREQRPEPIVPNDPFLEVVQEKLPALAGEWIGSYLEAARLMGQRTAQLHLALGSIADDPAFSPEPITPIYQRSTYQAARNWVYRLGQLLRRLAPDLPEDAQADAHMVLGREGDIIQYLRAIVGRRITAQRIRCHGDFRLENILYTGKDFVVIDFEGEILRPLNNRRHKRSPLRDVAGWLHSMYFAVQSVLQDEHLRPEDKPTVEPWARFWQWWVSVAFVKAYLETAGAALFLPRSREEMQLLLDYCLLGRGIYELRYHLMIHPDRAQIPLRAILHLLHERDRRQSPATAEAVKLV